MNCIQCHHSLGYARSGFRVCPQCGTVNHLEDAARAESSAITTVVQPSREYPFSRALKSTKLQLAVGLVVTLLLLGGGMTYGAHNINAQRRYDQAVALNKSGDYDAAGRLLAPGSSTWISPALQQKIAAESARTKQWQAYARYQAQAKQLASENKYDAALDLLKKISKDYPSYASVSLDVKTISAQLATAQQQAAVAAVINKAPIVPKVVVPAPKAVAVAPIVGKRFVSTAATSALMASSNLSQAQAALQEFFNQYGMTVQITKVTPSSYIKTWATYSLLAEADLASVKTYGAIMIDEWSKYPLSWVKNSKMQSIVFTKNIAVSGQIRGAVPDVVGHALYYDPIYETAYGEEYGRRVVHHEYGHIVEYNYFDAYDRNDPTWQSYNPPGFAYGKGGASCYDPATKCLTGDHPLQGFASGYSTSAIGEDKAEVYAYLMTGGYYQRLKGWLASDPYLAKKVDTYKAFISSHSPEMSGDYYDSINP